MRKVKFAFLFVLVLCIAAATFVACNPTDSGGTGTPTIPVQPDVTPPDSQGFVSVSGGDAWDMFIDAARESNSDTGHFVYSDVVIGLDYAKDALGYSYALKVQSDIDLNNDANSQILLELWKADGDGTLVEMLLGLYYFDSTVVYDCTGLKSGATVVKTDDLNLTAVVKTLRELLTSGEEGEYKSLAQFILNDLLTMDEGLAGSIISLIPNLLGSSRLETASDGTQRLTMPIGLSDLLGGVLGGLLTPGPDSLIPADVYDMVEDLLGIDLKLLSTIKGLNVYIVADLTADDADGKRELDSVDVQIGVDFDTVGSSLEEIYGTQQSHIDISVGGDGIQWNNDKPNLDVRSYLTSAKAPEGSPESDGGRGLTNIDELQDYSLLTVDLTVSLDMVLKEYSISPSQLIAAFGTLIKLPEETVKQLGDFLNKQINIAGLDRTLQIHISGGIDMFDNSGTNLLIELTGADKYNDVRASIAYVGAEEALFVDLTGILGTGKVYITDINVNDLLGGLIDQLIGTIRDAIKEAGLIDENKEVVDDFVTTARELIANGDVIRTVGTSADGEPIADTLGLVKAIIENIDVDMAENIFNLKQVQITLTQEILDYIFYKLIFVDANTGEPTGEKIPIAGDVVLELTDNGFASSKDITIDLDLAAETGEDNVLQNFASLGVGISARFGSVENENYFDNKIAAIKADRQNGKYIKLLSFDMLKDEDGNISFDIFKDAAGNFTLDNLPLDEILAGIDSVEVGLQADILLDVKGGEFADIVYDGSEDFLLSILAAFEESFSAEATLTLRAEVTDIAGLIGVINGLPEGADIGAVLPSLLPMLNIYIELAEKGADASAAPLRAWLVNGVLHLATSEDLGGLALMVDIKPFLGEAGTTSDAISVAETDGDGIDIMGILLPLLAADDTELALGDLYVDVAIGSIMLSQVLSLLKLEGVTITDASGEDFGLDVGVSITLSDGLHIAGGDTSEGLSVGAAIGFGENFDLGLTLGGINAVINGESNIKVPEDIEFVDFLNEPYVNIGLTLGIEGDLHQSSISLGEGVGEILFPEGVGVDVALSVAGKLDLGTILAELMGTDAPERANRTELAVSIVNNLTDGDPEVLLAAYYRDGILYVDASALIGARVSVEIDLMGIVADLLKHEHVDANNDGKCDDCNEAMPEAGTSAISAAGEGEGVAPKNGKTKLDLLLYISSKGVMIELAQTAAKAIASAIGIDDIGEIGAALSLNWSNLTNPDGDLLTAEATIGDLADVMVSLSSLSIGIGAGIYDEDVPSVIPSYVNLDNFSNIGKLALAEGADGKTTLDTSELALDNIYAEISGSISLGAIEDGGSDKWEVGTWIDNFTSGSDTITEDVKSLIKRLVIAFALDNNVSTQLDFTLRALIRLPEELDVSDTSALVLDILGMSDIALEITSPGRDLLSVYVISGGDGTSTLYIASDAEGIIGGKIAVPGINIAELFASGEEEPTPNPPTPAPEGPTEASALVAADPTEEHTCVDNDNDGKCDVCGKAMPNILDTILSVISSIMMTDEELKVGFGANFIGALLSALLPGGYELNAENFIQLDPNNSYLSLFYGKGEGDQRDIRIDLALAADPAMIGLSLFGIKAAVNDADATVVPEGVHLDEFKSIFAEDGAISLSAAIGLELKLKGTDSLPDGELPVGDMLSAFIANLALNLGLKIEENISLGVEISVQGNIYFDSEEKTELAVEIKDSIGDTLILGAYLRGKALYVDMGIISEHNFVFEETGIVAMVLQAVKDLLQGEEDATSLSEATTAAGDAEEEALDALEIVMELSSGHIALHVTEAVLLGLLGAVGGEVDIAGIFGALDLGAVADVDIDFEDPSIVVSADTNYAALKLSVTDILISNIFDGETGGNTLTGYIDGVIENGNFQSYSASSKARFDIALSVEYSADAYYTEIKGDEIDAYPLADRYSKLPDGTFVQDNNGTYVREGKSLSDIVDALLEMPALKNALDGALSGQSATLKDLVNMLIASLGIELYIDDPIGDSLDINITGILDLEALEISELLQSFNKEWLDLEDNATKVAILEALDLCIEIVFNPEDGPASAYIALYLIDGYLYIDLSGLGGPKISADLFGLLEKIEFDGNPFYTSPADGSAEGEAVTAATAEAHECYDNNGDGKCDYPGCGKLYASDMVGGVLNALIRAIVLRTNLDAALEGDGNIFKDGLGIDVMLPANMLGAVVALITGAEEDYVFEDFVLNSDESKISLNVGGGNGIELAVSATTDTGFNLSVAMNAGIGIDVATADDSVMTSGEMKTYLDMTELVNTVIGLINGGEEGDAPDEFGSQQITLSISGKAEFSSKSEGSYDVGSLLQQYIEDLILEINTENTFEDGIAFRLTVSADLGNIGFGALTNGKLDDDQKLDAFLKGTDLTAIEAALELLDRDEAGNITDDVLAGIYLSKGNLYLDGTGVFDIVDNYSYVANFLTFVIEAVNMSKCSCGNFADADTNGECDNCGGTQPIDCYCGNYADADENHICDNCGGYDPYCHCKEFVDKDNEGKGNGRCDNCNNLPPDAVSQAYAAVAAARAQALTAAEGDDEVRDAIAEIVYSDTAMQIVITKSVISALLAALMPDLGSLADIFDSFEVSLGAEIGKYDYVDIYDADLYKKVGDDYVKITKPEDPVEGTYYVLTADGEYIEAQPRYTLYEMAEYALNENGTGTYVRLASDSSVILDRDRYTFYYQAEGGNYIGITDLSEIGEGEAIGNVDVYVIRGGSYCAIERDSATGKVNTYDRRYGYVRSEHGELLRVYNPHTDLDEFYLILGAEVGTMNANLAIGGIQLEFGRTDSIIPDYITAGKTKAPEAYDSTVHGDAYTYENGVYTKVEAPKEGNEYYYDVPLLPFYDSVITVGASVELELAITEGEVDIGQIFAGILGDLEGMVIQIPDTSKGYSSAHLRLDLTLVLDMFNLPGSEIEIELYNLSSESGAEVRWLAAYYMNDMIYLDLSFFGLPRLAVPMTEISTLIEDLLSDLLNTSIYDNVEIGTGASEAITADDTANADADEAADMSLEDKVASLLISKRKLSVVLGNGIMRWLLSVITIGDMPLNDLVYEELQGSMNVTIDISDGIDVSLGAELRLEGDRYELYEGVAPESETDRFYVFTERAKDEKPVEGLFVLDEEEGAFREASDAEINAGELTLYVRHKAVKGADSWTYYTYTAAEEGTDGTHYYDEAQDAYVAVVDGDSAGKKLYNETVATDNDLPVYRYVSGADANPNDYDTVLDLYVGVNNIDLFFTEEREFTMDRDYLETFHDFNSLDTVSLSETISLELLFSALDIDDIDLRALLEYLFPDSELDFDAVLSAVTGSDLATEILRRLNLTVSLEFKLGAFLNYLRSLAATYDLKYGDKHDVALESLTGDIDLITFINTISALIGAKKVPAADGNIYYEDADVDDLLGLEDFLNFINASVELTTVSNDGVPEHTMLGVYLSLGSNEGEPYESENPDHEGQNRYSNYFASEDGNYGYDEVTGEYKLLSVLGADYDGAKYSRDTSFLYPDVNGDKVRADAGLYVNLSYFGQPGVYMNLSELMAFIGGMMGEEMGIGDLIPGASEAITAADEDGTADEGGLSLPIDLGELLGGGIDIDLPLLTQQISSYIKAFVYGVRITSTYIRILVQTDYLNQLLDILLAPDGSPFEDNLEFNQSYLGINVDVNNYLYAPLNERADGESTIPEATFEQIDFADTRFTIKRDDTDGMYYVYTDTLTGESYLRLRDDMTDEEEAAYDVTRLGYWNITPIETYLNVNGNYVLSSEASNTDWVQAERFDSAMAEKFGNAALEGTFVFYVNNGGSAYAVLGAVDSGIDLEDVWVVYPSENTKPFIEARVWLWGHSLSLGINMPETAAQDYTYTDVGERNGDYVRNEKFIYVPAVISDSTKEGEVYLYYRGEYYEITAKNLRNADGSEGSEGVDWNDFVANPYAYNLRVEVQAESFSANVPVTAADVYARDYYGYTYTYVGEGKGNFVRDGSTSLVSVPEFHADFNAPSDSYVYGDDTADYYVDSLGNLTTDAPDNYDGTVYKRDDFTFVHSTATGRFTSVADAKAIFEESGADGEFEAWLAANYDTDDADKVVYYDGEYIKYGDTGELYAINLTIRGSISLGQHMTYYTAKQWEDAGFGALPKTAYVLVRGEYVEFNKDNPAHKDLTKYYAYADSSSSMNKVLGAILGDMDALFTVSDGYKAVLPFEIRATVKIDYRNETDYDSLYVAGLELAIDVWRTEATDDTLTHVLGLYYMSDVWNIGDNNDANDIINSAALYADLSWILGPSAKFKIDLSDYPLETILNDKVNLGELGIGGSSEALTAAEGEGEGGGNPDVGNPDVATVLLNVFSRKIALQASAGFLKLIVGLIAPNTAATLEEMLPNISIGVDINAAPYDITIGATLFDEEGKGLLDLGITLNLFGTEDKTTGMQIDFGSIEDYDTLSAARFDAVSSEYMFYHALFSRVDEDYIRDPENAGKTYYIRDPEGGKEYIEVENAAERAANGERVFVFDDDERYQAFNSAPARSSWPAEERYALIPEGYILLTSAADYGAVSANGEQLYVYSHNFTTGADSMVGITSIGAEDIEASTIGEVGTKQVYVIKQAGSALADRDASGGYVLDANGAYKKVKGFGSYQTLLGLNLNDLISGLSGGGNVDIMGMLIDGIADSGLESIEIGGSLSLDIEFKDVLNWTRQMSRLMAVGGSESNYFSMLLSSMAMNSAEFVSKIGLDIDLAVRLEVANLIGVLPSLMEGGEPDIMSLLPDILPGAQIYLEIAIDTNFYGEDIEGAAPIQLWVEVTDEMMLDIYITAPDLGRVTDIARYNDDGTVDSKIGDFFAQGIKIVDLISLGDLLARGASADESLPLGEATIAAEEEGGGLIIDIGDANVGIVPENIWGILDLLLGQVLFANDMLSVGLTETILAGLIKAMVPEFPKEDLELLPTFKITSGSDTTGINLLFGDGSLGVQVQLGIQGGFDDFASYTDIEAALGGEGDATLVGIFDDAKAAYGTITTTNVNDFIGDTRVNPNYDQDGNLVSYTEVTPTEEDKGNVIISTETYALAIYASPEEVWLGNRHELSIVDGQPVFTKVTSPYPEAKTLFTAAANGAYGILDGNYTDYQGVAGGQVTEGTYVQYASASYMLVENIEKVIGKKYEGARYNINASTITGEYVLLGDVYVTIELDDLSLALNKPFSAPDEAVKLVDEDGKPLNKSEFTAINKLGIRLKTSLDIGFWGETGASVNLGELADLILGIEALKTLLGGTQFVGSDLGITVGGDIGDKENAYYTVGLDAYFKFDGTLQVKLDVIDNHLENHPTILSVILEDDTLYAYLPGVLGEGVKGKITGLGLKDTLFTALAGAGLAESSAEATTAAIDDTYGMTLHDYAYIAAAINPGYFSLQLTLAAVQAILAKVSADSPDLAVDVTLPDLGDIKIESYGDRDKGNLLSLSVKMSEAFGVSMDVKHLYIGTVPIYTETKPVENADEYKQLFDVASGELNPDLTISLSANASLAMTSKNLKPGDDGYDDSLAGWAIGLLTNLLGANAFFVSAYDISDTEYNKYGGPIYTKDEAEGTYKLVGTLVKSTNGDFQGYIDAKTGETVMSLDGLGQLYRTTMIEATFAESEVNISIELEADLNLGALISYGIGGILLSDLRLAVKLGSPFTDEGADTTVLEVYYLGSSRLSPEASGSIYTMRKAVNDGSLEAFSDAIYIDASGLGLGKIKFQGIAGLLGANIGQIYDEATAPAVSAAEGDTTEGDTTEDGTTEDGTETAGSGSTVSVDLAIDIAENYIGLTVDRSLIEMIFGMIDTGNVTLPQIQNLGLGLTFGENGLSSLALSSTVDPAGTGLHLTLGDFKISLDKSLETDDLVGRVQTQFAGITYSQTAGTMTLISELLEGLNAHLSINIDKQGEMIVQYTGGTSMEICPVVTAPDSKGTVTITGTNQNVTDGPSGVMGTVPNDYLLVLEAVSKHTEAHNDNAVALNLYFGNNSLWLGGVNLGSGDASVVTSLLRILNGWELGSLFDLPGLLGGLTYSDADNNEWSTVNPVATTAAEGAEPASEEGRASTAADVIPDIPSPDDKDAWTNKKYSGNQASHYKVENGASTYSYDLKLEGLVNKVSVNLFTKEGYQPYLSSMKDGSLTSGRESSLISVNIELTKQGYNELMIFVYTMLLSLIHVKSDLNANWGRYFVYDGEKFEDPSLTVGWAIYGTPLTRHAGEEGYDSWYSGHYYKYVISNLFRELDSIQGDSEAATQARVDLLTPYVKSLPISLLNWIVHDMANMNRDTVRALMSIVASSLGNITCLLATALPPFADMEDDSVPNPSLNLYIDLAPQTTFYGFKDGREIVPGIQSIELMVNAEKYGYGKNLQQGSVTGEIEEGGSSTGNFDNAYVLSINPLNLIQSGSEGEGLISFLEADRLSSGSILTTNSGVPVNDLHIVVTDVASKEATMYRTTTGEAVGSDGTLNAKFLTDKLPTTTRVEVVDPAVSNHDVTVVWDAGAIDYTPAITHIFEDDNADGKCDGCGEAEFPVHMRLAGFVYGYAMNLVVAKIPVYIVPDQQFVSVAPANGGKLELKMDGTGNVSLPDLVRIKFSSGRSSVFGTARINAEGGIAYALRKSGSNFQFKVTNASGAISYGYYPITTQSTDTVTYELALYPAYNAYTSEDNTVKVADVEYYVLEGVGIMPVGSFSWDLSYFDYGWDGASRYAADGDYTAKVGITYQWGYSAEQTHEISVPVTAAKIDSKLSRYAYTGDVNWQLGNEFNSWNQLKEVMGITSGDTLASDVQNWFARITGIAGGKYLKPGDTSRATGSGIASKSVVGWDVSALVDALNARVGEELEVQVTMFVEGFTIWRQYEQDAAGNLSLIHGMMDDVGINYNGTWVVAYDKAHHQLIVDAMDEDGTVSVAQPVTVTVTIGAEPDFAWKTDDTGAASANSYRFSDGTVIDTDGGVQRYEITTAAQLYGSMPESGVVVDGATGRTKAARFDWNGFVYDTDLDYDVARLSVETGGVRSDSEVIVTLADNDEVKSAAAALTAPADGDLTDVAVSEGAVLAKRIDEAKFRAMSIDPLAYATFGDYLAAKGFDGASVTLVLDDGSTVTATATSWSSVFKETDTLSLAGGVWQDNVATFNGADGKTYQTVVPIIVNARTIEDTEIVLAGFDVVSETRRFSEMVKRYVGDGQIIEISYSLDSHMPTSVAIYNPFAFKDNDPFTKDIEDTDGEAAGTTLVDKGGEQGKVVIKITFAEGGEREYPFTLKTVAEDGKVTYITAPADTSKSGDAQVINYTIGYSEDSEGESTAFSGSVEVSFRALRLNANNISSDIAYGDLDDAYQVFAPYENMKKDGKPVTPLWSVDKTAVGSDVTVYIDGMFVPREQAADYTTPAEGMSVARYKLLEGRSYNASGNSYVLAEGDTGAYVYVYAAEYVLKGDELKWDHSGISYNYNGGVKRTSVTIKHGEGTSAMTGTIQMPVNIVDGKINELYFEKDETNGYAAYFAEDNTDGSAYFAENWDGKRLVFDPFGGIEIDALIQVPGEGGVMVDGTEYVYFPTKVGFKTAGDYTVDGVSVTWSNLAGIRDTYRGGDYNVRLTVAAQGEYTPEGETEPSYAVAAQGYTARGFVSVTPRVAEKDTLQSATKDAGNKVIGLPNDGLVGHDRIGEQDNIDPYTFDISSFREEVEKITSVSVEIDGVKYFFGTGGTGGKAENGEDPGEKGYKLTWSFTSMTVNYLGGKVALIAQLTGPDGSVQNYEITYLVQRKLATSLTGTKGGAGNVTGYTVGSDPDSAEFGVAKPSGGGSYEIDPYNPFTRTLPTGWEIGVKVWNASLEDGNVVFTPVSDEPDKPYDETLTESYLTATMPSNANLTIAKIQEGGAAGEASLQITGGQRIRIPVSIKEVNISGQSAPSNLRDGSGALYGSTTFTIEGQEVKVLIAWHGKAYVTYNVDQTAEYNVTFVNPAATSEGDDIVTTVTAPAIPGRTVTYVLTPYIGAIVDTAGRVVMNGDVPACQITGDPITIEIKP